MVDDEFLKAKLALSLRMAALALHDPKMHGCFGLWSITVTASLSEALIGMTWKQRAHGVNTQTRPESVPKRRFSLLLNLHRVPEGKEQVMCCNTLGYYST